MARTATKKL